MTIAELAPVIVSIVLAGGMYLYLLRERRAIVDARDHGGHPAE